MKRKKKGREREERKERRKGLLVYYYCYYLFVSLFSGDISVNRKVLLGDFITSGLIYLNSTPEILIGNVLFVLFDLFIVVIKFYLLLFFFADVIICL
jgi:hypothetical protein